jgi:hypothetical protein
MNNPTPTRPLQHVKTGDFSESFAQEAADRRKAYTRTRSDHESHDPQDKFLPFSRRQGRDVEEILSDRKSDDVSTNLTYILLNHFSLLICMQVEERKWFANSFRLSCYRRPHEKDEQMLILGIEPEGQSQNVTGKDLRWM